MSRRRKHDYEYAEFGRRVRQLRQGRDWSQLELAARAELSASYLAEVERGGRNPSLEVIFNLAAALNASAGYLVDGIRYELPPGLDELAALWTGLSKTKQQVLVQLASLLQSTSKTASPKRPRSSSAPKRRA